MLEQIKLLLENIKSDIIQDQVDKRIIASGGSAASLTVDAKETSGELSGSESFYYQWKGRGPGKPPPTNVILEWIESKRIQPDGISIESLAFLIARKIGNEGSDIYLRERPGLALDQIFESNLELFEKEIEEVYAQKLSKQIEDAFGGAYTVK